MKTTLFQILLATSLVISATLGQQCVDFTSDKCSEDGLTPLARFPDIDTVQV
jgi:hypothetical protein